MRPMKSTFVYVLGLRDTSYVHDQFLFSFLAIVEEKRVSLFCKVALMSKSENGSSPIFFGIVRMQLEGEKCSCIIMQYGLRC